MKNRRTLAIIAIVLSAVLATGLITWQVVSTVTKVQVATINKDVAKGELISTDKIVWRPMTSGDVQTNYITKKSTQFKEGAFNQYATIDMKNGDILTSEKVSTSASGTDNQLLQIESGKQAVTISIPAGASSLSNKLRVGDIIKIYTMVNGEPYEFDSLQYVRIDGMTTADYQDVNANANDAASDKSQNTTPVVYSSFMFIVTNRQAKDLMKVEKGGGAYITLVSRGNEAMANSYLAQQENILKSLGD